MQRVLARHGFWGVVALSSYPNSMFDFVGVCCGSLGMRFRVFLGATLLGKGIIKASWQCALFTMIFSAHARAVFVQSVGSALDAALPASLQVRACPGCGAAAGGVKGSPKRWAACHGRTLHTSWMRSSGLRRVHASHARVRVQTQAKHRLEQLASRMSSEMLTAGAQVRESRRAHFGAVCR
jgi:hypothetical protein